MSFQLDSRLNKVWVKYHLPCFCPLTAWHPLAPYNVFTKISKIVPANITKINIHLAECLPSFPVKTDHTKAHLAAVFTLITESLS